MSAGNERVSMDTNRDEEIPVSLSTQPISHSLHSCSLAVCLTFLQPPWNEEKACPLMAVKYKREKV